MVDEQAPHDTCPDGEEVPLALPVHTFLIDQANESLMDQGSWLQGVLGPLALHELASQTAQLGIDEGEELVGGKPVVTGFTQARDDCRRAPRYAASAGFAPRR